MSGTIRSNEETPSDELSSSPLHYPTMSHVKRIVLEFESRRLLRAEFGGFYDGRELFSSSNPISRMPVGRPLPVHSLPEVKVAEQDSENVGEFYDQVPDHLMFPSGCGMPRHVEKEMLKRQHSLLFECNWWLEGEKTRKKPSFKKKVKKFFSSLLCSSHKKLD